MSEILFFRSVTVFKLSDIFLAVLVHNTSQTAYFFVLRLFSQKYNKIMLCFVLYLLNFNFKRF